MKKPRNAGAIGKLKLFLQNGQRDKGLAIFKQLAKERSYYGFMAADYLQQDYALVNKPIILEEKNKLRLLLQEDFLIISEFRALKLDKEAQQFWWQAVRNLKGNGLLAAAKIAQQWKWHKQAILTVARAKYWDDVALRFPIEYEQGIQENASKQQLDTAIIYGLIRRESMFDETAGSPVGAMGLMQMRGVAIFAKACFGHPSPSKQQKLNATTYASGGPDSSSSPRPDPTRGRNIGSK
ncbi:transglycosylase SLT domain-containing protein [Bathymodiolus platifrons methanotrophic gill symbiont]|uniref:transglycosylase SLT domain-containing protein n=1 Tax=Bathymodiolus platifrons methanotrophic gill symbiont TaxID=113268 RepID=UPI001C8E264A|nr:transglycosylase SLT domain-containing protein [Bathymodiolus platifrons methanotrophic gill symbiont]